MQTTSLNDSLFSDFYQVGGYSNLAGVSAGLLKGSKKGQNSGQKFSDVAKRGRGGNFLARAFMPFTRVYDEIVQDFQLSDFRINQLWGEHRSQGGKLNDFKAYVSQVEKSKVEQQIINEQNTLPNIDDVDISDVDFTEKKGVPLMYIGLGAVALVGITILIVKKF